MTPKFELIRTKGMPVTDEMLLADLRRVANDTKTGTVSRSSYDAYGAFAEKTVRQRFGTWNKALIAAGLTISNEVDYSDERLFENILTLWQHLGRQPRRSELTHPPSVISQSPYNRRFKSWTGALQAFVAWAEVGDTSAPASVQFTTQSRSTGRDPSLRLRWKVLQRDSFTCRSCGKSPATTPGTELHVDHCVAWSNGGETTLENLQTLCSKCNLGKSNLPV